VLPFAQPNQWRAQLSISQGIYGGGATGAANKVANAAARSADVGLESAEASAVLNAATVYYDAILADRLLEISGRSLAQAEESLRQAELRQSVGRDPEFELLRARVAVDNQQVALINARRSRDIAYQRVGQLLGVDASAGLSLTTTLDETDSSRVAVNVAGAAGPDVPRAPIRQAIEGEAVARGNRSLTLAGALPQLSASATIGVFQGAPDLVPTFGEDDWAPYQSVGVSLAVPLFNGTIYGAWRSAQAQVRQAETQLQLTRETVDLDTQQAEATLEASVAQWQASTGAVEQARRAYEIAELRFREGLATQLELTDSRLQLDRAEANRAQAARDLGVARIRIALLPSLPVQLQTFAPVSGAGSSF
jgi:outer membrane protein TolC